jgi:hypothetical protein
MRFERALTAIAASGHRRTTIRCGHRVAGATLVGARLRLGRSVRAIGWADQVDGRVEQAGHPDELLGDGGVGAAVVCSRSA